MFKILRRKKLTKSDFQLALEACRKTAKHEASLLREKVDDLERFLTKGKTGFERLVKSIEKDPDFEDPELQKHIDGLLTHLQDQLNQGMQSVRNSLKNKEKNLSQFTVTLFGRTKAGKSTIREALTHGGGETIGKGAQRTTRDIRRYTWNNLQIIDTPGIAAYEGDDDVTIAESVIDESDVILFLITNDSFQASEFERLADLKAQNKPVIILLNVKQDIDNSARRKIFLRDFDKIVSTEGQSGNIQRIHSLAKEHFGHASIEVIPIHAMSAFEATREKDESVRRQLNAASRIGKLRDGLEQLVTNQGIQKRTLTFRDDHIFYLNSLESVYWEYYQKLRSRVSYLRRKRADMVKWFDDFIPRSNSHIENSVKHIYEPLFQAIDDFVDEYAGEDNASAVWKGKVTRLHVEDEANKLAKGLLKETRKYLEEFTRQIQFDFQNINFDVDNLGVEGLRQSQVGRVARWGSAGLGAVEGALLLGAAMNWWNPAGWVMAVVGGVSLLAVLFSLFWGDDSKRFERQKRAAKKNIFNSTEKMQRKTTGAVKTWFYNSITKGIQKKLKTELRKQLQIWDELLSLLEAHAKSIGRKVELENKLLFTELITQTSGISIAETTTIESMAREQGSLTKLLVKGGPLFASDEDRKRLEHVTGERIIAIRWVDDPVALFCEAIRPAEVSPKQVSYDSATQKYTVSVQDGQAGPIIGKKRGNIRMTARLLKAKVDLQNG